MERTTHNSQLVKQNALSYELQVTRRAHTPVLLDESVGGLNIRAGFSYVDGTAGLGGHARKIMEEMVQVAGKGSKLGQLILIDKDKEGLDDLKQHMDDCDFCSIHNGSFGELGSVVSGAQGPIGGVLLDLGISSAQIDEAERGFAFKSEGPLDMRIDREGTVSAAEIVNESSEGELFDIIATLGEERFARRIASKIIKARKSVAINTTTQLGRIVADAIPKKFHGRIHPATKTFMALRIRVNDELGELERGLESALEVLAPTGRLAVISFHSLEDRIVKKFMAAAAKGCVCPPQLPVCQCGVEPKLKILTKRPIQPTDIETANNPRSRSAKLRIAERTLSHIIKKGGTNE